MAIIPSWYSTSGVLLPVDSWPRSGITVTISTHLLFAFPQLGPLLHILLATDFFAAVTSIAAFTFPAVPSPLSPTTMSLVPFGVLDLIASAHCGDEVGSVCYRTCYEFARIFATRFHILHSRTWPNLQLRSSSIVIGTFAIRVDDGSPWPMPEYWPSITGHIRTYPTLRKGWNLKKSIGSFNVKYITHRKGKGEVRLLRRLHWAVRMFESDPTVGSIVRCIILAPRKPSPREKDEARLRRQVSTLRMCLCIRLGGRMWDDTFNDKFSDSSVVVICWCVCARNILSIYM